MSARGFTLLEVLITLIVLAVGMLGLANLQSKIHVTEVESYQRAQAVVMLQDMVDRLNSNRAKAASYADATELGTGGAAADCSAIADLAARDRCEWQEALLGASEARDNNNDGDTEDAGERVGAMIGARGCIAQIQAINNTPGVCTPGVYRITVAWQGLHKTAPPPDALTCGLDQYGDDALRRVVTTTISIGTPTCPSS